MVYGFIIGLLYCIGSVIITVMCDMVWHCITLDHWSRFLYLHYLLPWRRCSILECIFIIFAQTVFRNQSILCCIAGFEFFFTYLHNDKLWGLPRRVFTLLSGRRHIHIQCKWTNWAVLGDEAFIQCYLNKWVKRYTLYNAPQKS